MEHRPRCPLIRPSATFSRVGEKGQESVTSPVPGEVAAQQRVRARDGGESAVVLAPPHPAFGHLLPRWGEGTGVCHLARPGRGRCAAAGEGSRRGRVGSSACAPHPAFGHLLPRWGEGTGVCHLARPGRGRCAAAGEGSRRGRVGSSAAPPHPAFGHLLPRWGEGTGVCHLSRPGRGRCAAAGEGSRRVRVGGSACAPSSGLRPPSPALGRRDRSLSPLPSRERSLRSSG